MAAETGLSSRSVAGSDTGDNTAVYAEGIIAGSIGAATIAAWFLLLDSVKGHPFFTPTVLGTALFRRGAGLATPDTLPVDFEMVLTFTWVHVLVFLLIGIVASRLLGLAETNPSFGFGILLLFVVFECGFLLACMLFAEPVLRALTWPEIMIGNLLAAAAMAAVFWRRHPQLAIQP